MDLEVQLRVAIALLDENRTDPLKTGVELAVKVLSNILASPDDAKYRTLRITNARIANSLWLIRGGRSALLAAGFCEVGETIVMADPIDVSRVERVVSALQDLLASRAQKDEEAKVAHAAQVKLAQQAAQQARSSMRDGIEDDALHRREPGWKPKVAAAAAKGGTAITTASDIGASGSCC